MKQAELQEVKDLLINYQKKNDDRFFALENNFNQLTAQLDKANKEAVEFMTNYQRMEASLVKAKEVIQQPVAELMPELIQLEVKKGQRKWNINLQ